MYDINLQRIIPSGLMIINLSTVLYMRGNTCINLESDYSKYDPL